MKLSAKKMGKPSLALIGLVVLEKQIKVQGPSRKQDLGNMAIFSVETPEVYT